MKKVIKVLLLSLLGIVFLVVVVSYIGYSTYWAKDAEYEVSSDNLNYFHETYDDCRSSFISSIQLVDEKYDSVQIGRFLVESKIDTDLTIDWCYIPAKKQTEKLLILNSGLHGIEGYTGSAIQIMFINQILGECSLDSVGVLLVHGLNPFGFKYHRKVTENNVDLNRNCVVDMDMFQSENDGYKKLTPMLMPEGKVSLGNLRNQFFHLLAIGKIIKESMPVLRQAALQGQYDFDKGIYYGGKDYEPQMKDLKPFLTKIISEYKVVLNVDLHTAYGERGRMHLFLNPIEDKAVLSGVETVFRDADIDWGGGKDFYTINGEYIGWVNSLSKKALCIPMLFEFGTLDSQKTFGSLKSIQVMINENQGVHYGYKSKKNEQKAKSLFNEMYYPSSPLWRSKVIDDSYKMMTEMMKNFEEL